MVNKSQDYISTPQGIRSDTTGMKQYVTNYVTNYHNIHVHRLQTVCANCIQV